MSSDATRRAVPGMSARGSRSGGPPPAPPPLPAPRDLLELPLRANPAFRLVLFDRLPAGQRRQLAGLAQDPEHYGVLRPRRGTGLGLKAVDRETALLFLTLARPAPLPSYVRSRLGDAGAALALARLGADGVLEIELAPAGFVSGAAATTLFAAPAAAGGRLAELSRAALRYGQELARTLREPEPLHLSLRLYGYNRRPVARRPQRPRRPRRPIRGTPRPTSSMSARLPRPCRRLSARSSTAWRRWVRPASRGAPAPAACCAPTRSSPTSRLSSAWPRRPTR